MTPGAPLAPEPESGTSVVPVQLRFQPQPLESSWLATVTLSVEPVVLYSVSVQPYVQVAPVGWGNQSSAGIGAGVPGAGVGGVVADARPAVSSTTSAAPQSAATSATTGLTVRPMPTSNGIRGSLPAAPVQRAIRWPPCPGAATRSLHVSGYGPQIAYACSV